MNHTMRLVVFHATDHLLRWTRTAWKALEPVRERLALWWEREQTWYEVGQPDPVEAKGLRSVSDNEVDGWIEAAERSGQARGVVKNNVSDEQDRLDSLDDH